MAKARPDRIRVSLWDDTAGSTPLDIQARRMWPMGLVVGIFFAIFATIAWTQLVKLGSHSIRGVTDLMFMLFGAFWLLGWSVGVIILGALTVLLLCYRESAWIKNGRLVHVPPRPDEDRVSTTSPVKTDEWNPASSRVAFDSTDGGKAASGLVTGTARRGVERAKRRCAEPPAVADHLMRKCTRTPRSRLLPRPPFGCAPKVKQARKGRAPVRHA